MTARRGRACPLRARTRRERPIRRRSCPTLRPRGHAQCGASRRASRRVSRRGRACEQIAHARPVPPQRLSQALLHCISRHEISIETSEREAQGGAVRRIASAQRVAVRPTRLDGRRRAGWRLASRCGGAQLLIQLGEFDDPGSVLIVTVEERGDRRGRDCDTEALDDDRELLLVDPAGAVCEITPRLRVRSGRDGPRGARCASRRDLGSFRLGMYRYRTWRTRRALARDSA